MNGIKAVFTGLILGTAAYAAVQMSDNPESNTAKLPQNPEEQSERGHFRLLLQVSPNN